MYGRRGKARAAVDAAVLLSISLSGCTPTAGNCAADVTPPRISVCMANWVSAHPDTEVRVCLDGVCSTGDNEVVVTESSFRTPLNDRHTLAFTIEGIRGGSTVVTSVQAETPVTRDHCGQWSAQMQLSTNGVVSPVLQ
ncbi:hypothetical protein [Leifsonia sp. P73]|uniref:hypothetical protein n=1 Tax=Leifsonia sp. P73 TaxID=3423959 RepID=UPI003DA3CC47